MGDGKNQPNTYRIRVRGKLADDWSDWFAPMAMTVEPDDRGRLMTTLRGVVEDQAALQGILSRLSMLNLELMSVAKEEEERK
jgi:hypothetical protein